jgi:FlaA1/EpsC-like NDP-sugar epimerase
MLDQFRNPRFYIILAADVVIFVAALIEAYLLRFDFSLGVIYKVQILQVLPLFLPIKLCTYFLLGLYGGMYRYTSLNDLVRVGQACLLIVLFDTLTVYYVYGLQGFPRSIFILDGILTFVMSGGLRVAIRFFYLSRQNSETTMKINPLPIQNRSRPKEKFIIIVGAGRAGETTVREILQNPQVNCHVLGFLDDDRTKWGRSLHGFKVFGSVDSLPKVLEQNRIDEVLIATPSATGAQIKRIVEICKKCDLSFRTMPEIGALIDGKVSIAKFRDLKYEDLLRRTPVRLDTAEISRYLKGKRVLVTGAAGSIGSELCRQIVQFGLERLILLDANESNLFNIQMEMRQTIKADNFDSILTRVQHRDVMGEIFKEHHPNVVFHAAAYKHVPMLEQNPWEAIYNNVLGSQVIMDLSIQYNVDRFVLVSTDKAVRPTNVMGASKRITELILQSLEGNGTKFMAVRFGNVAGSAGSVLPLFQRQLEQGGPITVTHPDATRYFMTIPEAAQLILQAGAIGESGKIFVLEMGDPIKIFKMAEEFVRLSGKEPGRDIEIVITGLREGEKLYEELIYQGEGILGTRYEKIMVLHSNGKWNGMKSKGQFKKWLDKLIQELYQVASTNDADAIKKKLSEILPEYTPQLDIKSVLQPNERQDHDLVREKLSKIIPIKELKRITRRGYSLDGALRSSK